MGLVQQAEEACLRRYGNGIYTKFSGVDGNGNIPPDNLIFTLFS